MCSRLAFYAAISLITSVLVGCTDKSCDKADSKAVCQQTKLCFDSGTAATSCRTAEKAAREYEANYQKNIAPALGGLGDALHYDPSKAASAQQPQQAKPQPQPHKQ